MHELFATQAILDKALARAAEEAAARITDLHLVVGDLSSYVDDSVQFYWDEISKGTIAESARLHFRHVAAWRASPAILPPRTRFYVPVAAAAVQRSWLVRSSTSSPWMWND
jgi:hypothetical protein